MANTVLHREAEVERPRAHVPSGATAGVLLAFFALLGTVSASALALVSQRFGSWGAAGEARFEAYTFSDLARTDPEGALMYWLQISPSARLAVDQEHEAVVEAWLGPQVERLKAEIERGDCDAARERNARVQRLAPGRLPAQMACEPAAARIVVDRDPAGSRRRLTMDESANEFVRSLTRPVHRKD